MSDLEGVLSRAFFLGGVLTGHRRRKSFFEKSSHHFDSCIKFDCAVLNEHEAFCFMVNCLNA